MSKVICAPIGYTLPMRRAAWRATLIRACGLALIVSLVATMPAQYDVPRPQDAAVAALRKAVSSQRDGSHLPLLFALRQLHDPDLKPLFYQLAQSGDWQSQVQAVLALAEIDPSRRVDTWLLASQVRDQAQEMAVANALDLDMLVPEQFADVLSQDTLNPMARLMLCAEQISHQQQVDVNELERLSKSDDTYVAGFASILLAQLGKMEAWTSFQKTIDNQDPQAQTRLILWLLDAIGRYKLSFAAAWVREQASSANADETVQFRAVYSLLLLDPKSGIDLWSQSLGASPTNSQLVRYGLMLLAIGKDAPASAFDRLRTPGADDLVLKMADAGSAISAGKDPSPALIALLDMGHHKTIEWVMSALDDLPSEQAAPMYRHLIEQLESTNTETQGDPIGLAVKAVAKLFEIDPDWVLAQLRGADDDGQLQQSILLGLFQVESPHILETVRSLRRIGSGRADSLALLLIAKHSPTLTDDELKQLGTIASGGGRVSDVLQVQAAWFYIKHTNNVQTALGSIFTK
jgi:hypothetical protein